MAGKERILYRVERYGVGYVVDFEMCTYFPGGDTQPHKQQIDKFCYENLLSYKLLDNGAYVFWKTAGEVPEFAKEQANPVSHP